LRDRVTVLTRYFLLENPDILIKDKKRAFTDEERLAIWILGGKKCAECDVELSIDDMHADHHIQWSNGGNTTLSNGRCLCQSCNTSLAKVTK
jgi:5-methylcytosine-specific restriction endonuclease McrA